MQSIYRLVRKHFGRWPRIERSPRHKESVRRRGHSCESPAVVVLTIYPYLIGKTWVFDDSRTSLKEEAFVCGMSEIISRVVELKEIPNAAQGFALRFSDRPFRGFDVELSWCDSEKSQAIPVISGNLQRHGCGRRGDGMAVPGTRPLLS
jgi:hypothetical protein